MIPVDMLHLETGKHDGIPGDCLRCCIASMLELPAAEVPHFADGGDNIGWVRWLQQWLSERGWWYVQVDRLPWFLLQRCLHPLVLAGGPSPRGPWGHMVVGELTRDGFRLVHDPHPSRAGLAGNPEHYGLLVRYDAAPKAQQSQEDTASPDVA